MSINILNKADTLKKINSIRGRDNTLKGDIQLAFNGAFMHAAEHGDLTLLTKLVNAVNATAGTQLRKFAAGFAPVKWNKGKGFVKVKKGGAFNPDAIETDWSTYAPESVTRAAEYDADKLRAKVARQIEAAALLAAEAGDVATANAIIAGLDALTRDVVSLAA